MVKFLYFCDTSAFSNFWKSNFIFEIILIFWRILVQKGFRLLFRKVKMHGRNHVYKYSHSTRANAQDGDYSLYQFDLEEFSPSLIQILEKCARSADRFFIPQREERRDEEVVLLVTAVFWLVRDFDGEQAILAAFRREQFRLEEDKLGVCFRFLWVMGWWCRWFR